MIDPVPSIPSPSHMLDMRDIRARYARLYTPLVSDTMERMGRQSTALATRIQCLCPAADPGVTMVGFAYPCRERATDAYVEIDRLLHMIDSIPAEAVVVVGIDREVDCALWGGLMSAGAQRRGAVGAVCDGPIRDLAQIAALGFTVFGTGRTMLDIRGRAEVVDFGCAVECGGVMVQPGDLIMGDANGVICVPHALILPLLEACEVALADEQSTQRGLETGEGARDLFSQYGRF